MKEETLLHWFICTVSYDVFEFPYHTDLFQCLIFVMRLVLEKPKKYK